LTLLFGFRTLEQVGCARSQGNQAFQRRSKVSPRPFDAVRCAPRFRAAALSARAIFCRIRPGRARRRDCDRRAYANWLATSDVPKLFVKAEPGLLAAGGANLEFAHGLPAQTEVTVSGLHFLQEDSPDEIGRAIAGWMGTLD
jgi:hypothetical protein